MSKVLILGATSDMAVAIAKKFASFGFDIQLAARSINQLQALKSDLEIRYEIEVETYKFDACNFDSHNTFYQSIIEKPDIVICVFGYMIDEDEANKNWNEAYKMMLTNYVGAVSILSIIANDFEHKNKGTIVGISSVAGERGREKKIIYGSSKAGMTSFLSGLRNRSCKKGVHIMTVKPGFVYTKMTAEMDLPKLLTANPDQVANAIFKGVKKKKNIIYTLSIWKWVMLIIRNIPESIFKKLSI